MKYLKIIASIFACQMVFQGCKHEPEQIVLETNYPPHIEAIVNTKCAVSGCHNEKSKEAAAGLSLETWDALFKGGNGGSVVIPFNPANSTFIYYINHVQQNLK